MFKQVVFVAGALSLACSEEPSLPQSNAEQAVAEQEGFSEKAPNVPSFASSPGGASATNTSSTGGGSASTGSVDNSRPAYGVAGASSEPDPGGTGSDGSAAGSGGSSGGSAGGAGTAGAPRATGVEAPPPAPEPTQCLAPGESNCSQTAGCCDGSVCVADSASVVCAALCTDGSQCASGCCAPVDELNSVCAPSTFCPAPLEMCESDEDCSTGCCMPTSGDVSLCAPANLCAAPPSVGCLELVLLANDGTFLGNASSNPFATDGICNEFSQYGSEFSSTSIYNEFSQYGSQFASLSAYNPFTSTPPVLYCVTSDSFFNTVSKNEFASGQPIDPDVLCAVLAANGQ